MIDRSHPYCIVPPDDEVIWRYMDLAKFMSLLQTSTLWLSRLDLLSDPFEGSMTALNQQDWAEEEARTGLLPLPWEGMRRDFCACCWHMNDRESAAMWSVYQREGRGIAVRTTVGALDRSLRNQATVLYLATINYLDYATARVPDHNAFIPMVTKRLSFEYEREVRLIGSSDLSAVPQQDGAPMIWHSAVPPGLSVSVDLPTLVQAVYLAPGTPGWFGEVVRSALTDAGVSVGPQQSSLDADPIF